MLPFDLVEPNSLSEAVSLLDADDPSIRPISGGTALMLMMKAGVFNPQKLISLRHVERKWHEIRFEDGCLTIGALATLGSLERSSLVAQRAPLIVRTLKTLSNVRIRNVATVGGALAHGDPHMDLPPVLIALGATVTVISPTAQRTIPVDDLVVGYYETSLAKNELISQISIPSQAQYTGEYFKVTTGSAHDWPALGIVCLAEKDFGIFKSLRLVVSAAVDRAVRLKEVESLLIGKQITDDLLSEATSLALEHLEFIADVRGSVPYKKELMRVYLGRAIRNNFVAGRED